MEPKPLAAPFVCLFCTSEKGFSTVEHIVPESLGNHFLVLPVGWVCDACNALFSKFENLALTNSILAIQRCNLGVVTKKRKPSRAVWGGVELTAMPHFGRGLVSLDSASKTAALKIDADSVQLRVPIHDKSNKPISKLLLKMGVEAFEPLSIAATGHSSFALDDAKNHLLKGEGGVWPYFVLQGRLEPLGAVSVFAEHAEARESAKEAGFDLFFHEVNGELVFVFRYGEFLAATALTSRQTDWLEIMPRWEVRYLGCPKSFGHLRS